MSRKYTKCSEVPSKVLCARLEELSNSIVNTISSNPVDWSEFFMRVPAEVDRDADLVLSGAAQRIEALEAENFALAAGQCIIRDGEGLTGDQCGSLYCAKDKKLKELELWKELACKNDPHLKFTVDAALKRSVTKTGNKPHE